MLLPAGVRRKCKAFDSYTHQVPHLGTPYAFSRHDFELVLRRNKRYWKQNVVMFNRNGFNKITSQAAGASNMRNFVTYTLCLICLGYTAINRMGKI